MERFTRRSVLAGASATAATVLAPVAGLRCAGAAAAPCPTVSLKEFLQTADKNMLTPAERDLLVTQAIELLDKFYVHLPLKQKLYGVDPIARLQSLQQQLKQQPPANDRSFHADMSAIFESLHDMHTTYMLPEPYATAHAWLPFKVEACVEDGQRKYIVSRVADGFNDDPNFVAGAEIVSWGGDPIEKAADLAGARGANPAAQRALGLARLTYRSLLRYPPPEQESVDIGYRIGGQDRSLRAFWSVSTQDFECSFKEPGPCTEIGQLQKFREFMYWPYVSCGSHFRDPERIPSPDGQGEFGYIRIHTFEALQLTNTSGSTRDTKFVEQFQALVAKLKDTRGLIIDVRDNGGGMSRASERCVQLVKQIPNDIEPARLYFRANNASFTLVQLKIPNVVGLGCNGMGEWVKSIGQAIDAKQMFSEAFTYTCRTEANNMGRIFPGPVIVVTSALSYSAAELFAGAFQDHGGLILGVDETTGGGGAGFRAHSELHQYFVAGGQTSPLQPISKGGFTVAFRRSKRVGSGAGKEVEDAGIRCDFAYNMTRNDLLNHNSDMKTHAAGLLAKMK